MISAVIASLVTAGVETWWLTREPDLRIHAATIGCVLAWMFFAASHTVLTYAAYRRAGPAGFGADVAAAAALEPDTPQSASWWRRLIGWVRLVWHRWWRSGNEAPSWSVQVSVLALVVVALIMVTPQLRDSQGLLFVALGLVASSWANVVVMYAVHYGRLDSAHPGLQFPGDESRRFVDYLYLAVAVQTTFGTTDVTVCTQRFRRAVLIHAALAFVFNSVIVAMIVSLLLGVGS